MNICDLKIGEKAKIINVNVRNASLKRKILEMGITKNTIIFIKKIAPFSDPISIEVRGYELCLRRKELIDIEVLKI